MQSLYSVDEEAEAQRSEVTYETGCAAHQGHGWDRSLDAPLPSQPSVRSVFCFSLWAFQFAFYCLLIFFSFLFPSFPYFGFPSSLSAFSVSPILTWSGNVAFISPDLSLSLQMRSLLLFSVKMFCIGLYWSPLGKAILPSFLPQCTHRGSCFVLLCFFQL